MEFGRFAWLVLLVCFGLCFSSTQGNRFYVGGKDGWVLNPSDNYIHWSGRNRFQVNDTLYFKYKKGTDSVLVVNKDDFFKCNTKNPIQKLDGGDSEFTLDRSGPFYFISGQNGNCDKGQKLFIVVLAVRHHNKPNPPVAPTTPPSTSPTSPSPKSPSPQYPHHPPGTSPSPAPVANPPATSPSPVVASPPATSPSPVGYPPATSPSPVGYPPATSPSPVGYPPATSPSPVGYTPATSPSPSTSTSPALAPGPSSSLTPFPSPPSPPPEGSTPAPSAGPTPPGTVSPPPGTADSTAPRPAGSGASHSVTAPSSVLVSSAVVFISVALMSSFVQGGAV
ncbi:hypothetical protein L3X38_023338 [Prunus dulcis]|uniref:Phytocyanin domain-containing protein n=1 Tax=Prunus dulcis TaxID=3755 RepID=A0AAD4VYS8_PRUDU|nr:hypothetical protein L3X38_023338 [Prunus dulcis]